MLQNCRKTCIFSRCKFIAFADDQGRSSLAEAAAAAELWAEEAAADAAEASPDDAALAAAAACKAISKYQKKSTVWLAMKA